MNARKQTLSCTKNLRLAIGFCVGILVLVTSSVFGQGVRFLTRPTIKTPDMGAGSLLLPRSTNAANTLTVRVAIAPAGSAYADVPSAAELDQKLLEFHLRRAQEGSAHAQFSLGNRYLEGKGVAKDLTLAIAWFKAAAQNGHRQAVEQLKKLSNSNRTADK